MEVVTNTPFLGSKITADGDCIHIASWQESDGKPRQCVEKQRHYSADKGPYSQGYVLSPCLLKFYAEYIIQNARLDEGQAGIKNAGRNINSLRYADDTTLMAESEELKSLLMKVKEENEKVGLKLTIQKTKIMASGPITSWQIDRETVTDFISWAPKSLQMVTATMKLKDAYSLEEKL